MREEDTVRIAVIGGSGFIGSRLLSTLREHGHDVVNLDLQPSALHADVTTIGDVRDRDAVRALTRGAAVVLNLAAEHRDDVRPVSLYDEVNVDGARSVVEAAEHNDVRRIVFTSSVAVYGLGQVDPDEAAPVRPFNDYGRTKLEAEQVYGQWRAAGRDRSLVVVRMCVVFGEGNRGNVYNLLRQIASRRFLMVGSGTNRKSMAYVGNVVEYLSSTLDAPPGTTLVNYADKPDLTTHELVEVVQTALHGRPRRTPRVPYAAALAVGWVLDVVARITGRTFPLSAVRVRKFCAETTVDSSRVQASGFTPATSLAEGLRRTMASEFPERVGAGRAS